MLTRGKSVEVLAYTAGYFDGEGCVSIQTVKPTKPGRPIRHIAKVCVGSTDYAMILWLQVEFGGHVFPKSRTHAKCKAVWGWQANNALAQSFCEMLLPYLRTKKRQAELLIRYMTEKKDFRGRGRMATPEEIAFRVGIAQQISDLNHDRRPQRLSETASRTEEAIV